MCQLPLYPYQYNSNGVFIIFDLRHRKIWKHDYLSLKNEKDIAFPTAMYGLVNVDKASCRLKEPQRIHQMTVVCGHNTFIRIAVW